MGSQRACYALGLATGQGLTRPRSHPLGPGRSALDLTVAGSRARVNSALDIRRKGERNA